jgi:hypothetical protein
MREKFQVRPDLQDVAFTRVIEDGTEKDKVPGRYACNAGDVFMDSVPDYLVDFLLKIGAISAEGVLIKCAQKGRFSMITAERSPK